MLCDQRPAPAGVSGERSRTSYWIGGTSSLDTCRSGGRGTGKVAPTPDTRDGSATGRIVDPSPAICSGRRTPPPCRSMKIATTTMPPDGFLRTRPGGEDGPYPVAHSNRPHWRAAIAAFLAFENANYITGQTIYSDVGEPPSGCYGADEGRLSTS